MRKIFFANRLLILARDIDEYTPDGGYNAMHKYSTINELRQFVNKFATNDQLLVGCVYFHDESRLWQHFCSLFRCIEAAGGIVENGRSEYLVINRLGVPDLPKGKAEAGESPQENALREVQEETGLSSLQLGRRICETFHTYRIGDDIVLKRTTWFAMHVCGRPELNPQTEENITDAQWLTRAEVHRAAKSTYASLREVFMAV